jgi:MarR family transcriptional regulator for hemolysin
MHHINRYSSHWLGQEKILITLLEKGAMAQSDLLKITKIKASSLSEALSKLENRRLIKRASTPEDKRSNMISLTKKGRHFADHHKQHHNHLEERMFGSLTKEEQAQMVAILGKMHANIDRDRRSHFHFRGGHVSFDNNIKSEK